MGYTLKIQSAYSSLSVYDQIVTSLTGMKFNPTNGKMETVSGATQYFNIIGMTESYRAASVKSFWVFMESTPNVDSYLSTDGTQTYRILLQANVTNLDTDVQGGRYQNYDNVITDLTITIGTAQQIFTPLGTATQNIYTTLPTVMPDAPTANLWKGLTPYYNISCDMNAIITITNRGFVLSTYRTVDINSMPGANKSATGNSTFLVQRPVDPTTGTPKVSGTAPIFALCKSVDSRTSGFAFCILREKDINASTGWYDTSNVQPNVFYKFSTEWPHPNLFDNMTHVIKFPFGFATTRHLYMEELDLISLVSASVFMGDQDMNITMYGETTERTYTSLYGDLAYGGISTTYQNNTPVSTPVTEITSGSRIGILTANGGI